MAEYRGIGFLRRKLLDKSGRVDKRYKYYEMKMALDYRGGTVPQEMLQMRSVLGWCSKAVDSLADRLIFRGFSEDNYDLGVSMPSITPIFFLTMPYCPRLSPRAALSISPRMRTASRGCR